LHLSLVRNTIILKKKAKNTSCYSTYSQFYNTGKTKINSLMGPLPSNLGMEIPIVYSESENNAFLRRLTFRADFLGLTFLTFWFYCCCRAWNYDSRMVWHLSIGHFMEEIRMDEIHIFWTSSVDCACIGSPMTKCFMFSEYSLRGLQCGAFNYTLQWCINLGFRV
jgi:hypothetical protein